MSIVITGKKMDVGEALRTKTQQKLQDLCKKYDLTPFDTRVVFSVEGSPYHHLTRCDIDMHVAHDVYLQATIETDDPHVSLQKALHTIETGLRRYKDKVIDHMKRRDVERDSNPFEEMPVDS